MRNYSYKNSWRRHSHAAEEATRSEGSAVLAKPFSRSALLRAAREVLQK